jgi:tetratricopeptide (TPR) repeat protein
VAARYLGNPEAALELLTSALDRLAGAGDLPEVDAVTLERALENELGEVLDDLGRTDEAVALWRECRRWAAATGNPGQLAYPLVNLARTALEAGRSPAAGELVSEALAAAEASGSLPVLADVIAAAGLIDLRSGHLSRAVARLRRAIQLAHDCGQLLSLPAVAGVLGAALLEQDAAVATRLLAAGRAWREDRSIALVGRSVRSVVVKAEAALAAGAGPAGRQADTERSRGERTPFGSLRGLTMLDPALRRPAHPVPGEAVVRDALDHEAEVIDLRS